MKFKILIIASMILCGNAYSQDYKPLFFNGPVHFESEQGYMVPYRIDSSFQHNDTTYYYSFHMIRPIGDDGNLCTLKGGSWIGKKIEKCPNGDWKFYNCVDIPILLKQNAEPGQNWVFYQLDDGSYFQAHVNGVVNKLVLGQMDSVKQICIQYFNSEGNPTDHSINDDTLELSKNFGLVSIFDFYYFPYSGFNFFDYNANFTAGKLFLAGIEELNLGYKNITSMDIFTYNINDEVHTNQFQSGPCEEFIEYKTIRKILQRAISPSNILSYQAEYCTRKRTFIYPSTVETIDTFHHLNNISYNLNDYSFIDKLSLQPILKTSGYYTIITAKANYKYIAGNLIYYPISADTIGMVMVDGFSEYYYYKNLGGPFTNDVPFDGCGSTTYIKYYKVSGTEYGTPYDCKSLLPVEKFKNSDITISPNPVNETFKIEGFDKPFHVEIFNMQGSTNGSFLCFPGDEINIANLYPGVYLFKLNYDGNIMYKRIVKI